MQKNLKSRYSFLFHSALWMLAIVAVAFLFYFSGMLEDLQATVFSGEGSKAGLAPLKEGLKGKGVSTSDSIIAVALGWVNFSLPFAGLSAFVGLVYAGFLYLTSFGNEEQSGKAKNILLWVALGIILIFSAYAITSTLIGASTADIVVP